MVITGRKGVLTYVSKNLLIIFYRNPELGKVKTRLAVTMGDANALAIYLKLVAHTRTITENLSVDKMVCYSHHVDMEDNWPNQIYDKQIQKGKTLGERLQSAVKIGFDCGYESVCVIGCDCYELTESIITQAFVKLKNTDAVIGPAKDGGYYLLGTKKFIQELFENKNWGTSSVAEATMEDMSKNGLSVYSLPQLTDVDTEVDLPEEILSKLKR